uniref:Serine/threonine protein phosphatase n=1 Tax=Fervidicoccus fontis TaxID=683846 RepID=A0A7J3ZIW9_9CREN
MIREALKSNVELLVSSPERLLGFLDDVAGTLQRLYANRRIVDASLDEWDYIAVGDLHGDFDSLLKAVEEAERSRYPESARLVFLGDYVDRGEKQVETFTGVLWLLENFPESTIVLRGNHEPPPELHPYPHDFPFQLEIVYGRIAGSRLYRRFYGIFQLLPLAVLGDWGRVIFVHGGLPTRKYGRDDIGIREYLGGNSREWTEEYTEMLWNDPIESDVVSIPSPRGVGYLWGRRVTEWLRERYSVELVVRGHEPCQEGFRTNHDNTVITVFSRKGSPYYNERACIMYIPTRASASFKSSRLICW